MAMQVFINKQMGDFKLNINFASESDRIGILGASGSGKSMTLQCIAGILTPDEGRIEINKTALFDSARSINCKTQKRKIGYLFQNYALFPTMTVEENIACGLKGRKQEKQQRVLEVMDKFALKGLEKHLPFQLSGGQQQRVALARMMAYEPEIILLDEPFSALDSYLRDRLQQEMLQTLQDYRGIVIIVSHNRDEIYRFSEELVVISSGKAVEFGKTKEIFRCPDMVETAKLTGCKNISKIVREDSHHLFATDWDMLLTVKEEAPEYIHYVGVRAHDLVPSWEENGTNTIKVGAYGMAELPFEKQFYIAVDTEEKGKELCWFVQKETAELIEKRGMPKELLIPESKMMWLR